MQRLALQRQKRDDAEGTDGRSQLAVAAVGQGIKRSLDDKVPQLTFDCDASNSWRPCMAQNSPQCS